VHRNSQAPEPGQRGQGLALGRAGAVQEVHEQLDPPPDDGRDASPHDVLDGGPAPLTRVNRLWTGKSPKPESVPRAAVSNRPWTS
jgi:hypothetical protein